MAIGKHGSAEFKQLAEGNTILRVQVGSGVHGIAISGTDDRDELGVCIEPPEYVLGLKAFEQYEHHTAWERAGGLRNRSGPGDLDVTIYSLRKFMRLALNGNPSIIGVFFTPRKDVVLRDEAGRDLMALAPQVISKEAGPRYLGYLDAQRRAMLSREGKGRDVTRPELIEKHGFDTKFAGHMIRLGIQGVELLSSGRISLPMIPGQRDLVRDIRTGTFSMDFCLNLAAQMEDEMRELMETTRLPLPEHPDRDAVNEWLSGVYRAHWRDMGLTSS